MDNRRRYILKRNMQVGGTKLIIHVSGASGSGKTTLGKKLKEKYGDKIKVKDIDDLRQEFIKKHYGDEKWEIIDKEAYQKYIDEYINKQTKPLVLVGLNIMPFWHKDHYYNVHSTHNYFIEIDNRTLLKQKCVRFFSEVPEDKRAMDDLVNNNALFLVMIKEAFDVECNEKALIEANKTLDEGYKKQGYKFMSGEDIFKEVSAILDKNIINKP